MDPLWREGGREGRSGGEGGPGEEGGREGGPRGREGEGDNSQQKKVEGLLKRCPHFISAITQNLTHFLIARRNSLNRPSVLLNHCRERYCVFIGLETASQAVLNFCMLPWVRPVMTCMKDEKLLSWTHSAATWMRNSISFDLSTG